MEFHSFNSSSSREPIAGFSNISNEVITVTDSEDEDNAVIFVCHNKTSEFQTFNQGNDNKLKYCTSLFDESFSDCNNNDPNNNSGIEDDKELSRWPDQEVVRQNLLSDARFIQGIIKNRSLEEVYSFLEVFVDEDDRIQRVIDEFIRLDDQSAIQPILETGISDDAVNVSNTVNLCLNDKNSSEVKNYVNAKESEVFVMENSEHVSCTEQKLVNEKTQVIGNKSFVDESGDTISDSLFQEILMLENDMQTRASQRSIGETPCNDPEVLKVSYNDAPNLLESCPSTSKDSVGEIILNDIEQKNFRILREMFPDADITYLKNFCLGANETSDWLNEKINELLAGNYTKKEKVKEELEEINLSEDIEEIISSHHQQLLEIFPDADPDFLLEVCEGIQDDIEKFKTFVSNAIEKRDYPTREAYLKRQKAAELERKYTGDFNIEEFLEKFPDPFKYFEEEKIPDATVEQYSIAFLQSFFRSHSKSTIIKAFGECHGKLSVAFKVLEDSKPNLKRPRYCTRYTGPPQMKIPFLQELAFLKNKHKILQFLQQKKSRKEDRLQQAKEKGEVLTCNCCYDDEVLQEDMDACEDGHLFCKECITKAVETQFGDGKTAFYCLSECRSEFSLRTLQCALKPKLFSKILQKKQMEEVQAAGIPGLETCPFCDFASIPPEEDKIFRCLNPDCMKESCRLCRELSHIPLRCSELEKASETQMRTFIEDKMTEALVRICWKCNKKFVKEEGCNKMTCVCGAKMCYICRQPVVDYSHFNGQGGTEYNKCPLFSDIEKLHFQEVEQNAMKAKAEIQSLNPNLELKNDPTKYLPTLKNNCVTPIQNNQQNAPIRFNLDNIVITNQRVLEPLNRLQLEHIILMTQQLQNRKRANNRRRTDIPIPTKRPKRP